MRVSHGQLEPPGDRGVSLSATWSTFTVRGGNRVPPFIVHTMPRTIATRLLGALG